MNAKFVFVALVAITIQVVVIADKGKFDVVKPSPIDQLPDKTRLVNFKDLPEENETNNPKKSDQPNSDGKAKDFPRAEKKVRTVSSTPQNREIADDPDCCGPRHVVSPTSRQETGPSILRSTSDLGSGYPSRYSSRPDDDRYGWHSYNPNSPSRRGSSSSGSGSSGSSYGSGQPGGDRVGSKPSYYGSDYERPGGPNRPVRPSLYSDSNGAYGSSGYDISRPSYGGRPGNGPITFGPGPRPGSFSGGPHGVYGTIGQQSEDEYPPGPDEGPDGPPPPPSHGISNIQTQKAVALKALAGVALLGAAAALATNPILLPIGVLAGRKKRSVQRQPSREIEVSELMKFLDEQTPEMYREVMRRRILTSPICVARLACEIRQEYTAGQKKNNYYGKDVINTRQNLRKRLLHLIPANFLDDEVLYKNLQKLIQSAADYTGKCNVLVCELAI